jgi:ATP-binding cassette subfamily A (ABC1) protein 3
MQRKLSLAIAFVGNPELVFLDEPSSGMDATARREIWDLIRNRRRGKIIVLTTHYMDEADVIGDRIAIMSHGRVKCCGSPNFLKQAYGCGYNLTFNI